MEYDHGYKLYKKFYRNIHCNRAEFDEQNVDHNYNYGMLNAVFIAYILVVPQNNKYPNKNFRWRELT